MEASSPLRSSSSGSKPADAAAIKKKGLGIAAQATLRRLRQAGHVLDGSGGELTVEIRKLLALLRQYAGLALSGDTTFVVFYQRGIGIADDSFTGRRCPRFMTSLSVQALRRLQASGLPPHPPWLT